MPFWVGKNIRPQMMLEKLFLSYKQMTTLLEYNYLLAPELLAIHTQEASKLH